MVRLINADDMIKSLMDMTFYDAEGNTIHDYEDRLAIVKSFVDPVPTVDVEPVRHGKWYVWYDTEDGRMLRCSECKMVFWVGSGRDGNYCPNCGADMKGENNE